MKPVVVTKSADDNGLPSHGHRVIFLGVESAPQVWFVASYTHNFERNDSIPTARIKVAGGSEDFNFAPGETCLVLSPWGLATDGDPNRFSHWMLVDPLTATAAQAECP